MIITLSGDNEFAIRNEVRRLRDAFTNKYGAHGIEQVDGEALDPRHLPSLLQGATLFASQRLVIIRGASANKEVWEALGDMADKVPSDTTVIIIEPSPDKRTKTYKTLKTKTDFKELTQPSDGELMQWAQKHAADLGGEIDKAEVVYLLDRAGRDQWRLSEEIAKLVSYDAKISRATIDQLVEPGLDGTVFALLDAALAGESKKVAHMVGQLKTQEDPYKLFGLLASQVHALAVVAAAGSRGADDIAKQAGMHPFVVRKTQSVAKRIGKNRIAAIASDVAQCDVQLKSTGADPWDLLKMCLLKVAR